MTGIVERSPDGLSDPRDRLVAAIENSIGERFVTGNRVTALRNGVRIFPSMLEAIEKAEQSIDFVTFVYWTGDVARKFAGALARKAEQGVQVRVILDAFGSLPMADDLLETMGKAGVQIERFRPLVRWKFWESDHRTHRKILIVDNKVGFTGGVGIASEWEGDARDPSEWRDTHFRIEGPAVLGLRAVFLTDWRDCGHPIDANETMLETPPQVGDVPMAVIDGSAQIGLNNAERALEAIVASATSRILVATPYLNPEKELSNHLKAAAARGVDVEILIPGPHIDKRVSEIAARASYGELVEAGVRVWAYQPTMMHVKAVMADGVLSLVGSVNINRRSTEKDEEVAVAILDEALTGELERDFYEDVSNSIPATPNDQTVIDRVAATLLRPINREL